MKTIQLIAALFLTSISYGQVDSRFELNSVASYNLVKFQRSVDYDIIRPDGSQEHFSIADSNDRGNYLGLKLQLGYRFTDEWSAGIHGGFGISIVGFEFFVPQFGFHTSLGAYTQYHFNDVVALIGTVGTNRFYLSSSNLSLGLGSQIFFGEYSAYGLHAMMEFGTGLRFNAETPTQGSDAQGSYTIANYKARTTTLMFEIGIVRRLM